MHGNTSEITHKRLSSTTVTIEKIPLLKLVLRVQLVYQWII